MKNNVSFEKFYDIMGKTGEAITKSVSMILDTKVKRVIAASVCGCTMGITVTAFSFLMYGRWNERTGVGGYEAPAAPVAATKSNELSDESLMAELLENYDVQASQETDHNIAQIPPSAAEDYQVTYQTYRVKKGDMIGIIADKYNITQDTIISVNNISARAASFSLASTCAFLHSLVFFTQ